MDKPAIIEHVANDTPVDDGSVMSATCPPGYNIGDTILSITDDLNIYAVPALSINIQMLIRGAPYKRI